MRSKGMGNLFVTAGRRDERIIKSEGGGLWYQQTFSTNEMTRSNIRANERQAERPRYHLTQTQGSDHTCLDTVDQRNSV